MHAPSPPSALYPPINRHAAIGDQRTGALVAADGSLNWWCLPDFDGRPMFNRLLDAHEGGFCRIGPSDVFLGDQTYLDQTTAAVTRWHIPDGSGVMEVADLMAWPHNERPPETHDQRVILRRVKVTAGTVQAAFALRPRWDFVPAPRCVQSAQGHGASWRFQEGALSVWASFALRAETSEFAEEWTMRAGEEHWIVLGWQLEPDAWSAGRAHEVFEEALNYWREWSAGLDVSCVGEHHQDAARRSALTVQLLKHSEHGSAVAALTTSLPERIGGDRNYDYRLAWVRDGSLALAFLARMGKAAEVRCYLHWLTRLSPATDAPLQVVYRLDGRTRIEQRDLPDVPGYRDSRPVRVGNHAASQRQIGSLAFMADCVRLFLENGGGLEVEHWQLICRAAEHTSQHWQQPGNGIWELAEEAHYVASRVMAWVVLERADRIARKTGNGDPAQLARWREQASAIRTEVLDQGWSETKGAFRQRYDRDALDAATLLIPLMGFLPPGNPRVLGTLAALERELTVNGLLHRFDPTETLGGEQLPVGKFEGAFLPCVFWHVHLLASLDRVEEARAVFRRCEAAAGPVGLFAEEMDAATDAFLGNTPLLFSHVEYVRAAIALKEAVARQSG